MLEIVDEEVGEFELGGMEGVRGLGTQEMLDIMKTMKRGKAVPEGRIPVEVWEEVLKEGGGRRRRLRECGKGSRRTGGSPRGGRRAGRCRSISTMGRLGARG